MVFFVKRWHRRAAASIAALSLCTGAVAGASQAFAEDPPTLTLSKADYADRMTAMWLGQLIGYNYSRPMMGTDAWLWDVLSGHEYIYLYTMAEDAGTVKLSPQQIAYSWNTHEEGLMWQANCVANTLMETGALPPSTSQGWANSHWLQVDAFIGAELFGTLAPGRPDIALDILQLPNRAMGEGYAAHAGQMVAAAFALAASAPETLDSQGKVEWVVGEAVKYLPATSRIREMTEWTLADFLANKSDPTYDSSVAWARVRDRYVTNPSTYGLGPANGVMWPYLQFLVPLIHGNGSIFDTWTASLAFRNYDSLSVAFALLGLMQGLEASEAQLAAAGFSNLSHHYDAVTSTHGGFGASAVRDYLPAVANATDSLELMSTRALGLVEQVVEVAGGTVDGDEMVIPAVLAPANANPDTIAAVNPDFDIYLRSANNQVRAAGGTVTVQSNLTGNASTSYYQPDQSRWASPCTARPSPRTSANLAAVADGIEGNTQGMDEPLGESNRPTFFTGVLPASGDPEVTLTYSTPVDASGVRVFGGDTDVRGGWASGARVQVLPSGTSTWIEVPTTPSAPFDALQPYQDVELSFAPQSITGVRVIFDARGDHLNLAEIDAVGAPLYTPFTYPEPQPPAGLDTTELYSLITIADWLRESDYTAQTWAVLAQARADADALLTQYGLNPASVTQDDADGVGGALRAAIAGLAYPADPALADARDALRSAIASAARLRSDGITAESWAVFTAALASARAALANPAATPAQLRQALSTLNWAGLGLRPVIPEPVPAAPAPVPPGPAVPSIPPPAASSPPAGGTDTSVLNLAPSLRIKVAQPTMALVKGSAVKVAAAAYRPDGTTAAVRWKSSNAKVASVSATGTIRAKKAGKTQITASFGRDKARIEVTVLAKKPAKPAVTSVKVRGVPTALAVGQTVWAEPTVRPAKAVKAKVTYRSSAPSVVAVDATGRVRALAPGTATITVKAGKKTATVKVGVS